MYRRLKKLTEGKFIEREKILYGVASIYTLAHKGLIYMGLNKRKDKIRIDTIRHDITVIDTLIYLIRRRIIDSVDNVTSEKELNRDNGFGKRRHQPDFIFNKDNKSYCVEVELSIKSMERLEKNIKNNFMNYDHQIWVVEKNSKIERNIEMFTSKYRGVSILYLGEVQNGSNMI